MTRLFPQAKALIMVYYSFLKKNKQKNSKLNDQRAGFIKTR